jgi:flagellar biosynthesis anti-sigma factor FlgM
MEINRVDSLFPIRPGRSSAMPPSTPPSEGATDRVQISPQARLREQLRGAPDIRADRVAAIRKAIESGTYEEGANLRTAIERLLDEMP